MTFPRHPLSRVNMDANGEVPFRAALTLGFWAALATATTYSIFELGFLLDPVLVSPWDVWIPIGASALIAPSFLLLTVSIHYSSPGEGRVWTHSAMLFATPIRRSKVRRSTRLSPMVPAPAPRSAGAANPAIRGDPVTGVSLQRQTPGLSASSR